MKPSRVCSGNGLPPECTFESRARCFGNYGRNFRKGEVYKSQNSLFECCVEYLSDIILTTFSHSSYLTQPTYPTHIVMPLLAGREITQNGLGLMSEYSLKVYIAAGLTLTRVY